METVKKRYDLLDVLRGICIIAIIMGHFAGNTNENYDTNFIYKQVLSWNMYLFMLVSGVVSILNVKRTSSKTELFKKRLIRLILPSVSWLLVYLIQSHTLSPLSFVYYLLITPLHWFLLVQFLYESVNILTGKSKHKYMVILLVFLITGGMYMLGIRFETLRQFVLFYPFYFLGVWLGDHNILEKIHSCKWIYVGLVLYPISMIFFSWKDYTVASGRLSALLGFLRLPEQASEMLISLLNMGGWRLYNHYVVSTLGCMFFSCLALLIVRYDVLSLLKRGLIFIGKRTMYIYILGSYIFFEFVGIDVIDIIISLVISFTICSIVAFVVGKLPVIDMIFFGGSYDKVKMKYGRKKNS